MPGVATLLLAGLLGALVGGTPGAAAAQDRPAIVIRDPSEKSYKAAVQQFAANPDTRGVAELVHENVLRGLRFSGLFAPLQERAFLGPTQSAPLDVETPIRCELWKQIGADALVEGEVQLSGDRLRTQYRIRDVSRGCIALGRRRSLKGGRDLAARMGKAIADDVVEAFTGKAGVSDTEIAFVSDRTGAPQVYVMDRDGGDVRRLTFDGSYNTSPAWSPDGRWIAYETRVGGQFDIWLVDPEGGSGVPLITHPRSDESPTWAPDGRKLAFSSTRRGRADVYVVDVNGKNLIRVTDRGENTQPAWGPYRR